MDCEASDDQLQLHLKSFAAFIIAKKEIETASSLAALLVDYIKTT